MLVGPKISVESPDSKNFRLVQSADGRPKLVPKIYESRCPLWSSTHLLVTGGLQFRRLQDSYRRLTLRFCCERPEERNPILA